MAAVTVCSDFGAQEIKSVTASNFASIYHEMLSLDAVILVLFFFFYVEFQATLLYHPHQDYFLFTFCHYIGITCISKVVIFPRNLGPTCDSSSLAFSTMYSACKLNIQPIWNQSFVPCPVLTVVIDLHTDLSEDR